MIRGERFELDLDGDDEQDASRDSTSQRGAFVGDVLERKTAAAVPPRAPALKSHDGFPQHQKRNTTSRFKQSKTHEVVQRPSTHMTTVSQNEGTDRNGKTAKTWEEEEKQRIDQENRQKLAQMSPQEIEAERQELLNSLGPALLQRLLQRSTIDSGAAEEDLSQLRGDKIEMKQPREASTKTVSFAEPTQHDVSASQTGEKQDLRNDDLETPMAEALVEESIHFPRPPQPPDLDPSSATFLTDLHQKYFPSLPSDPSKLEWMQSPSKTKYDAAASTLQAKELRFSFKGELIPPKVAAEIPVTEGLHHHGDAPDAAGYTIPELAHLAQSSVPAQRCIAFQTLGRILYRLGQGEFGNEGEVAETADGEVGDVEGTFGELARGLWRTVERAKVIEILMMEAEGNGVDRGRHVSAKAYAMEAVWLWRKGGGRRWKAS